MEHPLPSPPAAVPGDARPRLRFAPLSPFARKVLVAAHELGVSDAIALVACDVWSPETDIFGDNPLGKVPALRTADGVVVGSTLICEWLGTLTDARTLLPAGAARWEVLRAHAVADGIMEAAVAFTMERLRRPHEKIWDGWLARQEGKVRRGLAYLADLPAGTREGVDLYTVTLACTLTYLDLRLPQVDWRGTFPGLADFHAGFLARPSMVETDPSRFS